jgi:O-glycosyl hydrolase
MGVPVLVGFVNSAPAAWTTNGRCCGGALRPGAEADYARYLVDVVLELQAREGATLSYVSPMNEPDDSFPAAIQEGMAVPLFQRLALVRAVAAELARRAPFAMVIGDESSRVLRQFLRRAPVWLGLGGVARVGAIVHHLYDFPSDLPLRAAYLVGAVFRKPVWMSEICCFDSRTGGYGQQYDPTMAGAMPLANLVWRSLALAGHAAFHWWLALSPEIGADPSADPAAATRPNDRGWNDGLVYYDPRYAENANERLYVTKRFWALANFSRYVRPGAVRHPVRGLPDDVRLLAFRTADGWALVAIANAAGGASTLRVRVPVEPGTALGAAAAYETSAERDLEPVAAPDLDAGGLLTVTLPAQSVTTVLLPLTPRAG